MKNTASTQRIQKGKSLLDFPEKFVCIDLETTGLSPQYDEIIEICALKIVNNKESDRFYTLVKPENEIDDYISELTGITNELVSDAPHIKDVLPDFIEFLSDWVIVGHNVNFDINFIYDNYLFYFDKYFVNNYIDTMRLSKRLFPELPHHRLNDLIDFFNIEVDKFHRADADCISTVKCMKRLRLSAIEKFESVENFKKSEKVKQKAQNLDLRTIKASSEIFDENNPFYQKYVVFTGVLEKMTRKDAAQLVVNLGGFAQNNVTKTTDFLILGNNDYCKTIRDGKSSKQKKAENLILNGSDLQIMPESVFYDIIAEWQSDSE